MIGEIGFILVLFAIGALIVRAKEILEWIIGVVCEWLNIEEE